MSARSAVVRRCQYIVRVVANGRPLDRPCGAPATERHHYHGPRSTTLRDYCDRHKAIGDLHLMILCDVERHPVHGQ